MLLDSNILIYGQDEGEPRLDAILDRSDLSVASVSCLETLGFHKLSAAQKHWLETAISRMQVLPLDDSVLQRAIALRQLSRMGLADAIIAATALLHHLPLVTRNVDDFKHLAELIIINPFDGRQIITLRTKWRPAPCNHALPQEGFVEAAVHGDDLACGFAEAVAD